MIITAVSLGAFATTLLVTWVVEHRRRARAETMNRCCVVCESADLSVLAPGVYCCNACGHEGGEKRGIWARAVRDASFRTMEPQERRDGAVRDLRAARSLILGGLGDLARANALLGDCLFENNYRQKEWTPREHARVSGTGLLLQARAKLADASAKLGLSSHATGPTDDAYRSDPNEAAWLADRRRFRELQPLLDGLIDERTQDLGIPEGERMLVAIDRILATVAPPAPERAHRAATA